MFGKATRQAGLSAQDRADGLDASTRLRLELPRFRCQGPPFPSRPKRHPALRAAFTRLPPGPCGCSAPPLANLFNSCPVVPKFAMPHPVRRMPGKLVQPPMDLTIGVPENSDRFRAMLLERWHVINIIALAWENG